MAGANWTWRRVWISVGIALFLAAIGCGVRCAEYRQVGYTNDASMWVFVAAGLFAYYAAVVAFVLRRRGRRKQ